MNSGHVSQGIESTVGDGRRHPGPTRHEAPRCERCDSAEWISSRSPAHPNVEAVRPCHACQPLRHELWASGCWDVEHRGCVICGRI